MVLRWLLKQHTQNNPPKPQNAFIPYKEQKLILILCELPYKDCYNPIVLTKKVLWINHWFNCSKAIFQKTKLKVDKNGKIQ